MSYLPTNAGEEGFIWLNWDNVAMKTEVCLGAGEGTMLGL